MSSQSKFEQNLEGLCRLAIKSETAGDFARLVNDFRIQAKSQTDESYTYSFRNFIADQTVRQIAIMVDREWFYANPKLRENFLAEIDLSPQFIVHCSVLLEEIHMKKGLIDIHVDLSSWILDRFEQIEILSAEEVELLGNSLRRMTNYLAGTEFEHSFANALAYKNIGDRNFKDIAVKTYLRMDEEDKLSFLESTIQLPKCEVSRSVAASSMEWLRMNETRIVEQFTSNGLVHDIDGSDADLALEKGFPGIAWAIRLRQHDYQPQELLHNALIHGVHPDATLKRLLEEKDSGRGIRSKLESDAAILAYCMAFDQSTNVLDGNDRAKHVFAKALRAVADSKVQPAEQFAGMIAERAEALIRDTSSYDSIKWLSQIESLSSLLKNSRRFKGMKVESDLGM
ncbi:hypothetical protein [Pseudomonas putida]|uniref:Uncharacterized protein n=1 Tax=Pseudomonas putida TaxID=303 RepID=A0A8I1EBV9_PSEPU|nr:hypothetical protein [Pseudomonas putida]MBI6882438.1 hypothetical protein [Pseudomonas putida]